MPSTRSPEAARLAQAASLCLLLTLALVAVPHSVAAQDTPVQHDTVVRFQAPTEVSPHTGGDAVQVEVAHPAWSGRASGGEGAVRVEARNPNRSAAAPRTSSTSNIPPEIIEQPTEPIVVAAGDLVEFTVEFAPPEADQLITFVAINYEGGLTTSDVSCVVEFNVLGEGNATVDCSGTPLLVGDHTIAITAQDNGSPEALTTATVDLTITNEPPVIVAQSAEVLTVAAGDPVAFTVEFAPPEANQLITFVAINYEGGLTTSDVPCVVEFNVLGEGNATVDCSGTPLLVGDHTIAITAQDNAVPGGEVTATVNITITNEPPIIVAQPAEPIVVAPGELIAFMVEFAPPEANQVITFVAINYEGGLTTSDVPCVVDFNVLGEGNATVDCSGSTMTEGVYAMTITGQDNAVPGEVVTATVDITVVDNEPPVAEAGADQEVIAGQVATLDGSGSSDPDGDPLTYAWTLDGPGYTGTSLSGAMPTFCAAEPGAYTATLTVTDPYGAADTDATTVTALSIADALDALAADVATLEADGVLNRGQSRSLQRKLAQAQRVLDQGSTDAALVLLGAFQQQVLGLEAAGVLTEAQADALLAEAGVLIAVIEAPCTLPAAPATEPAMEPVMATTQGEEESVALANYPNPFNPATEITFSLPEAMRVELAVYDVVGRRVAQLVDGALEAGRHRVRFDAAHLPSGTYLYRLVAGGLTQTGRMVLLK